MTMLKRIVALLFCMILVTTSLHALAEDVGPNVIAATFNVTLHHNARLSRYGVTVYFDGIEAGHLDQGDVTTFVACMTDDRPHVLRFDPDKDGVPDRVWTLSNLQHGSTLTCEIQTKRNQVKILSQDLSVNGLSVFSVSPDTEARVKLIGTVITTVIKTYTSLH